MGTTNDTNKVFKHFIIYALGIIFTKSAGFLLIPIYTRYLPTSEYGILEIINHSTNIINLIFGAGLGITSLYFYASEKELIRKNSSVSTAIIALVLSGVCAVAVFLSLSKGLCVYFFGNQKYLTVFRMSSIIMFADMAAMVPMAYLQACMQSKTFVIISCAWFVSSILLNIIFVVFLEMQIEGVILSRVLIGAAFAVILLWYTLSRTGIRFDKQLFAKMLSFGLPFVPGGIFQFVLNNGDRFFIQTMLDSSALGVYSLGYKIGGLVLIFVYGPFLKIWGPYMFELDKLDDDRKLFGKYFVYVVFAYCVTGLPLAVFSKELIQLVSGVTYWKAYTIIPYIVLTYLFWVLAGFFDSGFYITRKTVYKPFIMGAATILVLVLYWILIPIQGMLGAAYATLISFAVFSLITYFFSNRIYPVKYPIGKFVCILGLGVTLYIISALLPEKIFHPYLTIIIKGAIVASYPVIMIVGGVMDKDDIDRARQLVILAKSKVLGSA